MFILVNNPILICKKVLLIFKTHLPKEVKKITNIPGDLYSQKVRAQFTLRNFLSPCFAFGQNNETAASRSPDS